MDRKLEYIRDGLRLFANNGVTEGFRNVENAEKFGGLLEDILDAVLEYQVRTSLD